MLLLSRVRWGAVRNELIRTKDGDGSARREPSVSTLAGKHSLWSVQKYFDIQPKRPLPHVTQIEPHHIVKCGFAAAGDLPQARDSRFYFQESRSVPGLIEIYLIGNRGPRTNQRHLALEDVDQLGKLVEAGFAEKSADSREPWVFRDFICHALFFADGSGDEPLDVLLMNVRTTPALHRSEFQEPKSPAILTHSFLPEQDWSFRR